MRNNKIFIILFFKFLSIFSFQLYSSNQEISQAGPDACCLKICSNLINCTCCENCICCESCDCLIQQQEARTRYAICSLGCHSCKECVCFRHNNENQIEQRKGKLNDVCLSLQSLCCYSCITLCTCNKSVNGISCFCDPLSASDPQICNNAQCDAQDKGILCAVTLEDCCEQRYQLRDSFCCCITSNNCCCYRPGSMTKIKPVDPFRVEIHEMN